MKTTGNKKAETLFFDEVRERPIGFKPRDRERVRACIVFLASIFIFSSSCQQPMASSAVGRLFLCARALLGFLRLALAVVLLLLFLLSLLLCKSFPLLFNTPLDALTPQGSTEACLLFFSVCARPIEKDQKTNDRSFVSLSFSPFFLKNIILIYIYIHASRLFFILMLFTGLSLSLSHFFAFTSPLIQFIWDKHRHKTSCLIVGVCSKKILGSPRQQRAQYISSQQNDIYKINKRKTLLLSLPLLLLGREFE